MNGGEEAEWCICFHTSYNLGGNTLTPQEDPSISLASAQLEFMGICSESDAGSI